MTHRPGFRSIGMAIMFLAVLSALIGLLINTDRVARAQGGVNKSKPDPADDRRPRERRRQDGRKGLRHFGRATTPTAPGDEFWDPRFTNSLGVNGDVWAAAVSGNEVYVGGFFNTVGGAPANSIAKWNGTSWSALGDGVDGTAIAIAVSGSNVYVGGFFGFAGNVPVSGVAKWDGNNWSALGSGVDGLVNAIAVVGADVYVGGSFTEAGGVAVNNIAKWNGGSWSALGAGVNDEVATLATNGSDVFVGGRFTTAGDAPISYLAKWNSNTWAPLGAGVDQPVSTLAVSGSQLYVAGFFSTAGGVQVNQIARWDGNNWSALGSGLSFGVDSLAVSGANVYAGGRFTTALGAPANFIAKWNGTTWSALGSGVSGDNVRALAANATELYAGGYFASAGGQVVNSVARWNGTDWSRLGSGASNSPNLYVNALASSGGNVYVGGSFLTAGGVVANHIAKWNGSGWTSLGSGVDNDIDAIAVSGNDVYVGGFFRNAGGIPAESIAKWNGSSWSSLGAGVDGIVLTIAISGSDIYVGGIFETAGGAPVNHIAKWNGSSWSALGSGVGSGIGGLFPVVNSIAISGANVYVGGFFTTAGGVTVNNIARWDGSNWSALGSGLDDAAYDIAVNNNVVYVGGEFTTAGGITVNRIARWNGSWSALGAGVNNPVNAIVIDGNNVYAGGFFSHADNVVVNGIARWNGSSWSALGSGTNLGVTALSIVPGSLYLGGSFDVAGLAPSHFFGRYQLCPSITVSPLNPALPAGVAGTSYSQLFTQTGGNGAIVWSVSAGALPAGLTLNSSTGVLSGAPTVFGSFNFTVRATDANGCLGERAYTLLVNSPCGTITVNPAALNNGFVGATYSQSITQTGGVGAITWSVSAGSLPGGLSLNASTGLLSGNPTTAGSFTFTIKATDANGCTGTRQYTVIIGGGGSTSLLYYPLPRPIRLLDTRTGATGCTTPGNPLIGGQSLTQPARISCDGITIPANAAAVVGNATVVSFISSGGFITLWPTGAAQPTVSNLNYSSNQIIPNAFTVALGANGEFDIFASGSTHFIVDITGYYAPPSPTGLYYHPLPSPIRLLDTRAGATGCVTPGAPIQTGASLVQNARLTCNGVTIPNNAAAVVGNATVVNFISGGGFITLWPAGANQPTVSNLNYTANQIIPNAFTVGLGASGEFSIFASGATDFIADITGYYSSDPAPDANGAAGLLYNPLPSPIRLLDTRPGVTACTAPGVPLQGGASLTQNAHVTCNGITIPNTALAVVGNGTVVNFISGGGFITLWPTGAQQPTVSNLNYSSNQIIPNAFTVGLNASGQFNIFASGATHFIADVTGFFAP